MIFLLDFVQKRRLQILLVFLAAIFFAASPKREKSFNTALLNPKYDVDQIELLEPGGQGLVLKKCGSFWLGQKESRGSRILYFVCDSSLAENFIGGLKKIVRVEEISDKKNLAAYGLKPGQAFLLCLKKDGKTLSQITFGNVDSLKRIFFSVPKRQKILSIDSDFFAPYLTADPNLWASPEIFPKSVVGIDKKYRHGRLAFDLQEDFDWSGASSKTFDAGDGNVYRALFLQRTDGDYWNRFEAVPAAQRPQEEKDALKKINAVFNVSAWTYGRVMEQE